MLGFTEIVKSACCGNNSELGRVRAAIDMMSLGRYMINSGPLGGHDLLTPEAQATAFSDCIVISDLNRAAESGSLLSSVASLSAMLLRLGILCRGGVATGLTFHAEHCVCGMGLINAYTLEHHVAIYPRIVIQDDLVEHASGFLAPRLKRDSDGLWFVDVFKELRQPQDLTAITREPSLAASLATIPDVGAFNSVREFLVAALEKNQHDLRKHTKYRWLANQFNEAITDYVQGRVEPISL
jgi:hypothetical protein